MKKEILLACAIFLLSACAATSTWISDPVIQHQENSTCAITMEPIKQGSDFFVAFKMTIQNKSDKALEIDWNKTRYVHAGKPDGVFLFQGIDAAMLKNKTVPADVIPPNGSLVKEITPAKTVALAPFREKVPADKSGISAGILPSGENGALFFFRLDGQEMIQPIAVKIIEKKLE